MVPESVFVPHKPLVVGDVVDDKGSIDIMHPDLVAADEDTKVNTSPKTPYFELLNIYICNFESKYNHLWQGAWPIDAFSGRKGGV